MSPQKLTEMETQEVKDMDQDDFRVRLLYDVENMKFWFKTMSALNGVLLTILIALFGILVRRSF